MKNRAVIKYYSWLNRLLVSLTLCFLFTLTSCYRKEEVTFYANGNPKTKSETSLWMKDGKTETYYEDGSIESVAFYDNGLLNGDSIAYFPNGDMIVKYRFVSGTANGPSILYWKGNVPKTIINYHDGWPDGEFVKYYPGTETKVMEGRYEKGKVVGSITYYSIDGKKNRECYHDSNGNKLGCKDL